MSIVDIDAFLKDLKVMLFLLVLAGDFNGINRIAREGDRVLQGAFDALEEDFEEWTFH